MSTEMDQGGAFRGRGAGDGVPAGGDHVRNLADLVTTASARGPGHPALIDAASGAELSWARLDAAVTEQAHRLRAGGLSPGDRVALCLANGIPYCVALFGVLRAGGVAVALPPSLPVAELRDVLDDSGARALIIVQDPFGDDGPPVVVLTPPAEDGPGAAEVEPVEASRGGEDIALLVYTSGTSGPARGAMLSHRALLTNARQCGQLRPMPVNAADRALLALPMHNLYGLGPGLLQVASVGATAVLLPDFDPEEALDSIARRRVTTVIGVPRMYEAWMRLPAERLREGMATVRLLHSGAAPLGAEVAMAVRAATGLDVFEGYGMTETGPVLTTTLACGHAKPGSVGRPLPGVEIRLVDGDGSPLDSRDQDGERGADQDGEAQDGGEYGRDTGRVAARGENLFSGYWPDGRYGPDADGWFRTGDLGFFDDDGDLHLVDRAADLVVVDGFNVYPHEVEHVVRELPGVVDAAVVGVPDGVRGESVKAVIVPETGVDLSESQVREHCLRRLAKFKVPTSVEFVADLPHSPTGKLARRSLRG